ncbi:hypothetical protein TPHA_0G01000 [Tetrapisispora phaffii CBS 4417]|uniref:Histone deacetylase complex subunit SAP30 Sin3 binding domain-containing protein n=1 Tax=Tetrapisispora phaffii (strain ATCC 24235 / CBS 4417 / NBRC 1672 / NRRL Y-8282 / UCD 70-5) TaxID=1071381 RepID=G8BVK8_TETPH|nr:hypothetical protein TPHA_0G01000 [Tetrapisispora phaffii CBS 4417]CCE63936.1 hypothetical protein TPHA_0G01000 [Tetrapisispora phaffii CBS 4417]
MSRTTNSNSESESKQRNVVSGNAHTNAQTTGVKNTGKQRPTVTQNQYIKNLVKTHITNNHPALTELPHPLDFDKYDESILRKYKDHFKLDVPDNLTLRGYLLGSALGLRTFSGKKNQIGKPGARITKNKLANEVKTHFDNYSVKENTCVPHFIYKVKTQKKKFKMEFKD